MLPAQTPLPTLHNTMLVPQAVLSMVLQQLQPCLLQVIRQILTPKLKLKVQLLGEWQHAQPGWIHLLICVAAATETSYKLSCKLFLITRR